jgi:hypothetical protein
MKPFDFFIYTAHKTTTNTLKDSLRNINKTVIYAHNSRRLDEDYKISLKELIDEHYNKNTKPLKIISIYREPIDRLISGFFQVYGDDRSDLKTMTIDESIKMFIDGIKYKSFPHYLEALEDICETIGGGG